MKTDRSQASLQAVLTYSSAGQRPLQEDCALGDPDRGVFVVADGFGGGKAGLATAQGACESVRSFLFKEAGDLDATLPFVLRSYFSLAGNVLFNALIHANRKALNANKGKSAAEKGGASVLAAFLDGDLLALANVGACSAWLVRGGRSVEIISPRTYARLLDPFAASFSASGLRASQRVPLMAIGVSGDLEPEIFECRVQSGDWVLLSTDGVVDELPAILSMIGAQQIAGAPAAEAAQIVESTIKQFKFKDNLALSLAIF